MVSLDKVPPESSHIPGCATGLCSSTPSETHIQAPLCSPIVSKLSIDLSVPATELKSSVHRIGQIIDSSQSALNTSGSSSRFINPPEPPDTDIISEFNVVTPLGPLESDLVMECPSQIDSDTVSKIPVSSCSNSLCEAQVFSSSSGQSISHDHDSIDFLNSDRSFKDAESLPHDICDPIVSSESLDYCSCTVHFGTMCIEKVLRPVALSSSTECNSSKSLCVPISKGPSSDLSTEKLISQKKLPSVSQDISLSVTKNDLVSSQVLVENDVSPNFTESSLFKDWIVPNVLHCPENNTHDTVPVSPDISSDCSVGCSSAKIPLSCIAENKNVNTGGNAINTVLVSFNSQYGFDNVKSADRLDPPLIPRQHFTVCAVLKYFILAITVLVSLACIDYSAWMIWTVDCFGCDFHFKYSRTVVQLSQILVELFLGFTQMVSTTCVLLMVLVYMVVFLDPL